MLSVDGVNAVTGQTASPSQGGYVLEPWETAEIAGWRKSLDDIAQFVFTASIRTLRLILPRQIMPTL